MESEGEEATPGGNCADAIRMPGSGVFTFLLPIFKSQSRVKGLRERNYGTMEVRARRPEAGALRDGKRVSVGIGGWQQYSCGSRSAECGSVFVQKLPPSLKSFGETSRRDKEGRMAERCRCTGVNRGLWEIRMNAKQDYEFL